MGPATIPRPLAGRAARSRAGIDGPGRGFGFPAEWIPPNTFRRVAAFVARCSTPWVRSLFAEPFPPEI